MEIELGALSIIHLEETATRRCANAEAGTEARGRRCRLVSLVILFLPIVARVGVV